MNQLLVYEKQPLNAALFARASGGLKLNEARSLTQVKRSLEQMEPSVVCLQLELHELTAVASVVRQIKRESRSHALVIGMPEPPVRDYVAFLYEAGVDSLFGSMLDRDRAVRLIRRRVALATAVTDQGESMKTQVWAQLPWKRYGTGGGS